VGASNWVMKMEPSDHALVTAALGGDAQAFGMLISRHIRSIYRLGYRISETRDEAEDGAGCLRRVAGKLRGFRGEARFTTWLHQLWSMPPGQDSAERDAPKRLCWLGRCGTDAPGRERCREGGVTWLSEAMSRLRMTCAKRWHWFWRGFDPCEAATALGVSEGTVSWRMSEVRKHLRELAERDAS
jgi:RNA polymerase sigma-70 factor (ECF subfamily)